MQAAGDSDRISAKFEKLRFAADTAHLLTPPQSEEKFLQTTISSLKSSSSYSDHDQVTNSTSYIESLKEEREQLSSHTDGLTHVFNLIDKEINRISGNDQPVVAKTPVPGGPQVLSEILPVPVDLYPNYNFVGRILGPRGTTAKQLENATGCKIIVHGRKRDGLNTTATASSTTTVNDGVPPTTTTSTPPTDEPLSIEVSCPASVPGAAQKLEMGVNVIKALLVPPADGQDELKRQQLMVLANMNGTYRPRSGAAIAAAAAATSTTNPGGDYQFQNLLPFGYRLPIVANCQHEMMVKSLLSIGLSPSIVNKLAGSSPATSLTSSDCSNPKCAILRSLIENNVPLSNNLMHQPPPSHQNNINPLSPPPQALPNLFNSIPKFEDVLNVMQWYEMINRVRLSTMPAENSHAQEISNRMCSSIKQFAGNGVSKRNVQRK